MNFQENFLLSQITTFRIGGPAKFFVEVANQSELSEALDFAKQKNLEILLLGGGSNVLISDKGFDGLVIKILFKGIEIVEDTEKDVTIKVGAGEIWDAVVKFSADKQYWGIENLSHIPGLTGGVPVQNVGAYGQEAADTILRAELYNLVKGKMEIWDSQDFHFGYRSSRLNTDLKNQFVVLNVYFRLSKNSKPNLTYIDLQRYFAEYTELTPNLENIREALREIRGNKFPDLTKIGTAGSFFKNLILDESQYEILKNNLEKNFDPVILKRLEDIRVKFPTQKGIKIPTAFLIEICGLKGQSAGFAKLWENQALVIVNEGQATALNVIELFQRVQKVVFDKTGMTLLAEPEFIGF